MEKDHKCSLENLPLELIELICEHSDDILVLDCLPLVNKVFWRILSNNTFWMHRASTKKIKFIEEYVHESKRFNYRKNLQFYPDMQWSDVLVNKGIKDLLREKVALYRKIPQPSQDRSRGVLLYGPSKVEHSRLVKALASEAQIPFLSISCSGLSSMWKGDSEREIKTLFERARKHRPAILFFEYIETLDGNPDGEGEGGRRVLTEFLIQCDSREADMYVIASTGIPWAICSPVKRRFEQRIFVDLPDPDTRVKILKQHLETLPNILTDGDITELSNLTTNYSSNDLSSLVREAALNAVRGYTHFKLVTITHQREGKEETKEYLAPCSPDDEDAWPMKHSEIPKGKILSPSITKRHFELALNSVKPILSAHEIREYEAFSANLA